MVVNTECAVHVRWLQQREDCVVLGWRVGAKAVGLLGSTAAAAGVRRIVSFTHLLVITGMLTVNVFPVWKSRRSPCHKTMLSMPQTTTLHWIEHNFTIVQRCTCTWIFFITGVMLASISIMVKVTTAAEIHSWRSSKDSKVSNSLIHVSTCSYLS